MYCAVLVSPTAHPIIINILLPFISREAIVGSKKVISNYGQSLISSFVEKSASRQPVNDCAVKSPLFGQPVTSSTLMIFSQPPVSTVIANNVRLLSIFGQPVICILTDCTVLYYTALLHISIQSVVPSTISAVFSYTVTQVL